MPEEVPGFGASGSSLAESQNRTEDKVRVGGDGGLHLSEGYRQRWGLTPGAEISVQETSQGLLIRRLDPPLAGVYVEPTSRCNLRCRTCVRNSWDEPSGSMSMDTYRCLIEGLREVPTLRSVNFWGVGEPLLHPNIVEMVAMARELGAQTTMITNALLLGRPLARELVKAGLDTIVVSVDGASSETYEDVRSGADLRLVQENVQGLQEERRASPRHNPEVGLEIVLMRRNLGELRKLRQLARTMGASFVVVTNVLPYTEEMRGEILYGLWASSSYPILRSEATPEFMLPRIDARRQTLEPLLGLLEHAGELGPPLTMLEQAGVISPHFGRIKGTPSYCRFVNEGTVTVASDGEVSPCVALMHSYPCYILGRRKLIRRHVLGNVAREGIRQIWERQEYVRFRDLVRRFDFAPCTDCGGCEMAESNEEDCYGNTFPVCGDCLWAKGVIQCP